MHKSIDKNKIMKYLNFEFSRSREVRRRLKTARKVTVTVNAGSNTPAAVTVPAVT